ncbi:MAG: polysaccharide deacetylase family protein [Clostridia bacterium]|nr:polysaccharide deacetylase family protein [Clostridia bacterium]
MKTKIWTVSLRRVVCNILIVAMLTIVSGTAVYGLNYVTSSTLYNGVYYSGNENSKKVSLMINVYWGTEYLDEMLDILAENDVKTTFFVGGTWAVKESDMLRKIFDSGHEIGNHGYYHKDQGTLSTSKNHEEIYNTHKLVKELIGVDMNLFAPPSGSYNTKTVEVATELGYKTIMWTEGRDTIDWRDKDSEIIYQRAIKNCKGGDFVLMHPTEATKNALDRIIKAIREQGFELCTVSENLEAENN